MGVFLGQTSEQLDGAQIGAKVEKILGGNLADHYALGDVVFLKDLHQFVELPDAEPFDDIHELGQFRLRLIREGGGHELLDAGATITDLSILKLIMLFKMELRMARKCFHF